MDSRILLLILYGVESICIWIGAKYIFGCDIVKKWFIPFAYGILSMMLFFVPFHPEDMGVLTWSMIILSYIMMVKVPVDKDWKSKLYYGFLLFYQEELTSIVVGNLLFYFKGISLKIQDVISSLIDLVILLIVAVLYNKIREKDSGIKNTFRKLVIPILIMVTVEIMAVIVYLDLLLESTHKLRDHILGSVLCIFAMISIGVLFAIVYYVKYMNEKMQRMMEMEKELYQLEVQHFEELLKKEDKTKEFRHDIINHLSFVDKLLCEQEHEEAKAYIQNMLGYVEQIRNSNYDTGNKLMNIMINYYVSQLDEKVNVSVKGMWKKETVLSDYDLGTIVSNLLKNAVEAIQVCDLDKPRLSIEIAAGDMFVRLTIRNSMKAGSVITDKDGNLQTTKKEKEFHGIGLKNIKETVQKNQGVYEYSIEENEFCSVVSLRTK